MSNVNCSETTMDAPPSCMTSPSMSMVYPDLAIIPSGPPSKISNMCDPSGKQALSEYSVHEDWYGPPVEKIFHSLLKSAERFQVV